MSIRLRLDGPHRYRRAATAAVVVAVGLGIAVLAAPRLTQSDPAASGVERRHESAARHPETDTARRVALTFDDLPMTHGGAVAPCDAAAVRRANDRLLATLEAHGIPAVGLVTAGNACGSSRGALLRDVLDAWLDAGHELGNHTYSHPDLNETPLARYTRDVERGAAPVDAALRERGTRLRYFRHPMLHAGDTRSKKDSLAAYLARRGFTVAPVTIDNQEWLFPAVYARAKTRGDEATMRRVVDGYIEHMEASFAYYERLSDRLLDRQIPQVLLLHVNQLNVDHLDALVAMIRARGYEFVGLGRALADPAYMLPDDYVGTRGLSWLQRWALTRGVEPEAEPREPEWIARLYREY